ncbi:MAG TPA: transposase [Gammaproteobacteria bacterium]
MPRANRHFVPGYVWHITHRCHKKDYLLKFQKDRENWIRWLYEARKRYGLSVLNYMVTCNHIHLLVNATQRDCIQRSMQLIAGRVAQEYNHRKQRKGAYWEDRYHATAIETDEHLWRCLTYIDLNMVRAGAVRHPGEWPDCGYHEIQRPARRYRIVDHEALMNLLGIKSRRVLQQTHRQWIDAAINEGALQRDEKWSRSLAVGSKQYVMNLKEKLGVKTKYRQIEGDANTYVLRETEIAYMPFWRRQQRSKSK